MSAGHVDFIDDAIYFQRSKTVALDRAPTAFGIYMPDCQLKVSPQDLSYLVYPTPVQCGCPSYPRNWRVLYKRLPKPADLDAYGSDWFDCIVPDEFSCTLIYQEELSGAGELVWHSEEKTHAFYFGDEGFRTYGCASDLKGKSFMTLTLTPACWYSLEINLGDPGYPAHRLAYSPDQRLGVEGGPTCLKPFEVSRIPWSPAPDPFGVDRAHSLTLTVNPILGPE